MPDHAQTILSSASQETRSDWLAFLEATSDVFIEHDCNLRCQAINPAGAGLLGVSASDMVGRSPQELAQQAGALPLFQNAIAEMAASVKQVLVTATKSLVIHQIVTKTGLRLYETAYTPVLDSDGSPIRVISVGREIYPWKTYPSPGQGNSNRSKNRDLDPQEDNILLQQVLDNIPHGIFWTDTQGIYQGCNQSWAEIIGVETPQAIIGKADRDFSWALGEADSHRKGDRQVMLSGKPELHLLTSRQKMDGEQIWFDACKVPLRDGQGKVVGLLCILERMTERRQQAEQLKKGAELLRLVLDNIPQAIFWKDRNSFYLGCNSNWAQAAGVENFEDVVGKTDFELFWTPEEAALYREQDQLVMETDTPVLRLIEHRLHADGKNAWIEVNKIPIHDAEGTVIGLLGTIEDITDRKQAENAVQASAAQLRQQTQQLEETVRQLQQTQAQLIQTEKMSGLGQLVAGIAHEINNPVNFIHGNIRPASEYVQDLLNLVHLYQQHYPTPKPEIQSEIEAIDLDFVREDLPKLLRSLNMGTERIKQIVLSLRNFSRVDEADVKTVDIHEGIDSTLLILQHRLKGQGDFPPIRVVKEYGTLPPVECYIGQLNQVFMNILANAIDALESYAEKEPAATLRDRPSAITIRTECVEKRVIICIRDNAMGMPETVRKRLFDPFFTTKPVGKGTGLGLSISYQIIVERHQGTLQCVSELGEGSEFLIELPIGVS